MSHDGRRCSCYTSKHLLRRYGCVAKCHACIARAMDSARKLVEKTTQPTPEPSNDA